MPSRRARRLAPADGTAIPRDAGAQTAEDARLNALFDQCFPEGLRFRPENATNLGRDKGPNADLKSKLADDSAA